jgi:putative NADPH-quinone reductase
VTARHVLFLIASARADGNSERLARRAAGALPADVTREWLRLDDHALPPFRDRPRSDGAPPLGAAETILLEATLRATDLVFVTPVYWYSLPAPAKLYLDYWTAWMRRPGVDFKARMRGRRLWAVVVDASEPEERAYAPLVDSLERTADYMSMRWMGSLHGHGDHPGDALTDEGTLARADAYFAPLV